MFKRMFTGSLAMVFVLALCQPFSAQAGKAGAVGNGTFPSFIPLSGPPEGVAVDKVGNVFISIGTQEDDQVWKLSPSGEVSFLASLGPPTGGSSGLAVDAEGNVYAAKRAGPGTGVYRITREGAISLLPGTEKIVFPNALAFDPRGNLYITETYSGTPPAYGPGGVWWVPKNGSAELLMRHELFTGGPPPHMLGFPIGANGVSWFHGALYVANTELAVVVRVPLVEDGVLAEPEVWAEVSASVFPGGIFPVLLDGLALDVHGNVYACVPSQSAIVRIYAADRTSEVLAAFPNAPLDAPLSLAFGTGKGDKQALFITNGGLSALFVPGLPWPGFGLVRVETGFPGLPLP